MIWLASRRGVYLANTQVQALRDGDAPNQHSFKCYTRWGWPEEAELMRREDR